MGMFFRVSICFDMIIIVISLVMVMKIMVMLIMYFSLIMGRFFNTLILRGSAGLFVRAEAPCALE
jgi:hypothetical protein